MDYKGMSDFEDCVRGLSRDMDPDRDTEIVRRTKNVRMLVEMMAASENGYQKAIQIIEDVKEQRKHRHKFKWIQTEMCSAMKAITNHKNNNNKINYNNSNSFNNQNKNITQIPDYNCTQNNKDARYTNNINMANVNDNNNNHNNNKNNNNNKNKKYLMSLVSLVRSLMTFSDPTDKQILLHQLRDFKILECLDAESATDTDLMREMRELSDEMEAGREVGREVGREHVDLNDPHDVFLELLHQVNNTPQRTYLLLCLQNFLRTDPTSPLFDSVWEANARFTGKANVVESKEELPKLLRDDWRLLEVGRRGKNEACKLVGCVCACHGSCSPKRSLPTPPPPPPLPLLHLSSLDQQVLKKEDHNAGTYNTQKPSHASHPPLPPPIPPNTPHPPPNPPCTPHPPPNPPCTPHPPPNPPCTPHPPPNPPCTPHPPPMPSSLLRHNKHLPSPSIKMKRLQWNKIPHSLVLGSCNVWNRSNNTNNNHLANNNHPANNNINFAELELMFGKAEAPVTKVVNADEEGRRIRSEEVCMLESKRSLNINIFLHQIKMSYEVLVRSVVEGREVEGRDVVLSVEKLKGLLRILPEKEELEIVKSYKGDMSKLGNAERFYSELINYPTFNKSVQTQLLKEEFQQLFEAVNPLLDVFAASVTDIRTNSLLPELFELVLLTGNFLNTGGYAGEALAFKLSCLLKLTDLRSNVQGVNLMHYISEMAIKNNANMRDLPLQLKAIRDATQYSLDSVIGDIGSMKSKLATIDKNLPALSASMGDLIKDFLKTAEGCMEEVEGKKNELEEAMKELALYLCEDEQTFKLDECLSVIHSFLQAFDQALKDNGNKIERMKRIKDSDTRLRRQVSLDLKSKVKLNNRKSENIAFLRQGSNNEFLDMLPVKNKRYSLMATDSVDESTASSSSINSEHDNNGDKLFNILNTSCISNGFNFDGGVRLRRKTKIQNGGKSILHERERSTPELDIHKQAFDHNPEHRASILECPSSEHKRKSVLVEKNVSFAEDVIQSSESQKPPNHKNLLPQTTTIQFNNTNTHYKNLDESVTKSSIYENRRNSCMVENFAYSGNENNTQLTEHAMMNWKPSNNNYIAPNYNSNYDNNSPNYNNNTNNDNTNFCDSKLKQKITKYRNNDQVNKIHESSARLNGATSNQRRHNYNGTMRDYERSMYIREGRFENESVCSGTDEGFESMRNSVVSEDNNHTSPLHDNLNNTLTDNNDQHHTYNNNNTLKGSYDKQLASNNNNNDHITCSLDSLVHDNKLSLPRDPIDIRGATSVVSVDLPKTLEPPNEDFLSYADINTPNKSSTSTLKSSGSGLHLEHSNLDMKISKPEEDLAEIEQEGMEKILRNTSPKQSEQRRYKSHSQPPVNKLTLKEREQRPVQRPRHGSTSDSSSGSEHKKKVNVNQLSARLSQPKRQTLNTYSTKQAISIVSPTDIKATKGTKALLPSDSFKRGNLLRSTLPVKKKDSSQPSKDSPQVQEAYINNNNRNPNNNHTPTSNNNHTNNNFSNDLPPKPPTRTTSMTTRQDNEITCSNRRRSTHIELSLTSTNSPQINSSCSTAKETRRNLEKPHSNNNNTPSNNNLPPYNSTPSHNNTPSLFKKMLSGRRQASPPLDNKITRPTKPRTQTLTSYKR